MDISMVTVTIYFVGIAAFVNAPPQNGITKSVIFPAAESGTYVTAAGQTLNLMPHRTYLYLRDKDISSSDTSNPPKAICERAGGEWIANSPTSVCKIKLNGAKVWTLTAPSDALTEDVNFRKMPSFIQYCPYAKDLPAVYTGEPDAKFVAARFDIKGGTMSACNRNRAAFVSKLTTNSPDAVLYIRQDERTSRIFLNDKVASAITIENAPDDHAMNMTVDPNDPTVQYATDYRGHFGWYYLMNGRASANCEIAQPTVVAGVADCVYIPGIDDVPSAKAAGSADCSNSNYP